MKKFQAALVIGLLFLSPSFADVTKAEGGGSFGNEELESLDGTGLIRLNGTKVEKEIHLLGSLISQNAEIGTLDVMGEANLTGTLIHQGGSVTGSFQATRSEFKKPIKILAQKVLFSKCKLKGIEVEQDSAFRGKQFIELRHSTIVDGPIHFKSGRGEVHIYSSSQVLGPISGGKVIKKY